MMPIPQDRIETPEIVPANGTETLGQVRRRLKGPDGVEKWRACVLVRSDDGRYAVVSVFDLRFLVWNEGPAALDRALLDLGLLQFQPGVEQDALELKEAEQQARQYGGYLVVLRSGSYAGLVQDQGVLRSAPIKPTWAFDLFDELIADADLSRTEFARATLNTTVAQVASELKALRDAGSAYVVVDKGGGTFGVMTTKQLDAEIAGRGAEVWGLSLRQFTTLLRDVPARERTSLGLKQALVLANNQGYLVITSAGQPVGLLPSNIVWRDATLRGVPAPALASASSYTLFNVPQAVLNSFPEAAEPVRKPRVANLWFTTRGGAAVDRARPLDLRQTYHLQVNIGQPRPESVVSGPPPAILEPPQETPEGTGLYVSLFADDFEIPNPTQSLLLPPWGDSLPAEFEVTPTRRTFGPDEKATIDVHIYYRCNLVQSWQVQAEVVPPGQAAQSAEPQRAVSLAARVQDYMAVDEIGPRHVSLFITRTPAGSYQLDFVVAADDQADKIHLQSRIALRREDLTHLITKTRRQLYNIARSSAYQQSVAGDAITARRAQQALALLGRQLYNHLFERGGPNSAEKQVAAWIGQNLPEGSTIQVIDGARDFVFPWSLIYDQVPWDEDGSFKKVAPAGFWGYRYQIELLTDELIETRQTEGAELDKGATLSVGVGLNEEIPWAQDQRGLFTELSGQCGEKTQYSFFDSSPELTDFLKKGNRHIFYLFCHGYTERMAADIQIGDDLIGEFKNWMNSLPQEQQQALKDQQSALFDVSDSWIKLTYGTVPLTMMEYYARDRFVDAPLIFLNMCESAQVLPSLSGGFIPFFLQRGARSVIGTECPMTSTFAHPFSREFFYRLLQGETVGRILWELRRKFLDEGNPLGFAYTLYGNAGTKLSKAILEPKIS
jgi:hypothetical protein